MEQEHQAGAMGMSSVQERIATLLRQQFAPSHLQVINESHGHNVAPGAETHFKVVVVSEKFTGQRAVQRHRMVYQALASELSGPVHALALHTHTPLEWSQNSAVPISPDCFGAEKNSH